MSRGARWVWGILKFLIIPAALAAVGFYFLGPYIGKSTTVTPEVKELTPAEQAAKELEAKNKAEQASKKDDTTEPKISVEKKKSEGRSYDSDSR